MYVKSLLPALLAAFAFNASGQLVRPGTNPAANGNSPAQAPMMQAPASTPLQALTPPGGPTLKPSDMPAAKPTEAMPSQIPASDEAKDSIRSAASRARALAVAPAQAPTGSEPVVGAIKVTAASSPGKRSSLTEGDKEPAEPRLVSIVGQYGRERAEISFEGVVYTVSLANPRLGGTGWRLVEINAASSLARIVKGDDKRESGEAEQGRRKGAKGLITPRGMTIGFSRKEADLADPRSPNLAVVR